MAALTALGGPAQRHMARAGNRLARTTIVAKAVGAL